MLISAKRYNEGSCIHVGLQVHEGSVTRHARRMLAQPRYLGIGEILCAHLRCKLHVKLPQQHRHSCGNVDLCKLLPKADPAWHLAG